MSLRYRSQLELEEIEEAFNNEEDSIGASIVD